MKSVSLRSTSSVRWMGSAVVLVLAFAFSRSAVAADQKAVIDKIKADNQAASSAFAASDFDEMKKKLSDAVALANDNGLARNKVMAQTYVLLGVLQVDGLKQTDPGVRSFAKAIDLNPAVQIPQGMTTKAVKVAWKRAENEDVPAEPEAEPAAEKKKSEAEAHEREKQEKTDRQAQTQAQTQRQTQTKEKQAQELAAAKLAESRGQAEKEKLEREKQDRDKAAVDTKNRIAFLEKDRADKDKALADARNQIALLEKDRADKDKALAASKDSDGKTRAAKEKLEKEGLEREKALADAKARIAALEKEKSDREKALGATKDGEARERAAKEKLEKQLQEIAVRDKDRRSKEEEAQRDREQSEAGPELPAHIREPITCTIADEIQAGADLFVHCAPQPGLGAKILTFYYRPSGTVVYNALAMDVNKKGWHVALVPGHRIYGKLLQYYVEARDAKQNTVGSNGKASSPNVAMVRVEVVAQKK